MEKAYLKAIENAKKLMYEKTFENKAPSWELTCLAEKVGKELAIEYGVDENIVMLTLYLQHLVFNPIINGPVQKNHPKLSAQYVINNKLLESWNVPEADRNTIIEAIKVHHIIAVNSNLTIEVIKNAECQKFITIEGVLIWLHELGLRGMNYEEAKKLVFYKMEQKKALLTLDKCINRGEENCKKIINMFNNENEIPRLKKLHSMGIKKVPYKEAIKIYNN